MVRDYTTALYEPAAASSRAITGDDGATAADLAAWKQRVRGSWGKVRVVDVQCDTSPAHEGERRRVTAIVDLDGLSLTDLMVQVLHGPIDSEGSFIGDPSQVTLQHSEGGRFDAEYEVGEAGPYGLTVRVVPHHPLLVHQVDLGLMAWAG